MPSDEQKTLLGLGVICAVTMGIGLALQQTAVLPTSSAACRIDGEVTPLPDLPEASGLAVSRLVPGRLWAHNDDPGQPVLFALDANGTVTARVRVTGGAIQDWEAIAIGPCPGGSCLYLGDIGDNDAIRRSVSVYRMPEPAEGAASVAVADAIELTYPDGAHDAEALFVTADGAIVIVTKGETGPVNVYRAPANVTSGAPTMLEQVDASLLPQSQSESRITDASASEDGRWVALRSRSGVTFYPMADFLAGRWRETQRADVTALREPQGEGLALGASNVVYLAGEGGGDGRPGTFARFTCQLPQGGEPAASDVP